MSLKTLLAKSGISFGILRNGKRRYSRGTKLGDTGVAQATALHVHREYEEDRDRGASHGVSSGSTDEGNYDRKKMAAKDVFHEDDGVGQGVSITVTELVKSARADGENPTSITGGTTVAEVSCSNGADEKRELKRARDSDRPTTEAEITSGGLDTNVRNTQRHESLEAASHVSGRTMGDGRIDAEAGSDSPRSPKFPVTSSAEWTPAAQQKLHWTGQDNLTPVSLPGVARLDDKVRGARVRLSLWRQSRSCSIARMFGLISHLSWPSIGTTALAW